MRDAYNTKKMIYMHSPLHYYAVFHSNGFLICKIWNMIIYIGGEYFTDLVDMDYVLRTLTLLLGVRHKMTSLNLIKIWKF